jgi:cation transporter-like permease
MITLLLQLIIVAIVLGLIAWLVSQIPFLAPYAQIIRVVCICVFVIYVIYILMGLLGHAPALPR